MRRPRLILLAAALVAVLVTPAATGTAARSSAGVWMIKVIAGNGRSDSSGDGGPARKAGLEASAVARDPQGNLYVADFAGGGRIRKITPAGRISTVAGGGLSHAEGIKATSASLPAPTAIALDPNGNLYVAAGYNEVRKVTPAGIITTVAGGYQALSMADGVPATSALLRNPRALALDVRGNLYIGDTSHVLKVTPGGIASTVAGQASGLVGRSGTGDGGPARKALLAGVADLAVDAKGNLYIADCYVSDKNDRIRKVAPNGTITTFAKGSDHSVAVDRYGNVYAQMGWAHSKLRRFSPDGKRVTTIAGSGGGTYRDGPARKTIFRADKMTVDPQGRIYVANVYLYELYLAHRK